MAEISSDRLRRKIKEILKDADLSTLSAKKVRLKLQECFDTDLADRKKEIDKITMKLIVEMEEQNKATEEAKEEEEEEEEEQNGNGKGDTSESEHEVKGEPPKKKSKTTENSSKKKSKKISDKELVPLENDDLNVYDEEQKTLKLSDEELAKRLQSFEETGRRTRGRATKAPREKKKREGGGGNSAYSRPCLLSADLAALMGTDKLARNEVVKKMWEIVKERKLQDPKDKRFMICDEQLQKIFGRKRVQTFGMMKYLSSHIINEGSSSIESVITNSDIYDDEADDDD
ncbi:uncharacterized protein LOC127840834 [Dreissena polymorpha]|uniref:Upstream activation factor subunit spp27 n=1 Tax=Dreissena polymorpha TaxID=45954 RepID=A0A9D4F0V5_DREPO|nr:uncharacterized protein LOC127840834 [Dreissena polymorpha]KAH3789301.1 hypothetical protein DPMN_167476 [Dreissena polymorpha]